MRRGRWYTRWLWALPFCLLVSMASAQSTGSSAGGGSWGSSSSGGGGSYSSSSSGSSSGAHGPSYEPSVPVQMLIAATFLFGLYWLFRGISRVAKGPGIDVSMVQLAIDARSRRFVQAELAKLAHHVDTGTSEGRTKLLSATAEALRSARLAWIYSGSKNFSPMPAPQARVQLTRLANDARAGFSVELVRAADGRTATQTAPELVPREHEGEGVVLVTLIVAAWGAVRDVRPESLDEIDALLRDLAALPKASLVALEVVWTPSSENDRMSTDELEAKYPTLTRLTAATGRVFCAHCTGPYAAELTKCPHCGAPAASAVVHG